MKKAKISLITVLFLLLCSLCVFAGDNEDVVVSLQIGNPIMEVNGAETEIDKGRGTEPIIRNGRTLVPIRAITEAFGGSVFWDEASQSVLLNMEDDTIKLVIDSKTAYLNSNSETLDVAPTVINGRTMLPIRFVTEGFNLGIAWDGDEQRIYVIKNSFDEYEYNYIKSNVPPYSGDAYVSVNGNKPLFKDYEIIDASFEYYSDTDELGRCDVCFASVSEDIMPTEERESISSVTPTGWINATYDNVDGAYLYNRCHLIGFQLTGENANERNLITGTRYLNIEGMLPFENMVADYVERTKNRVLYRSTPVFTGNNLVADGVLLEAYSVADAGQGISFCVYCYNVQPDINIDYETGASSYSAKPTADENKIYRTPTGKKYHFDKECGGKNSFETTLEEAKQAGLEPCSKCVK